MASILKITDGTTTVDFIADSAYRLLDWSPAVASRRESLLAGRGPYTDVIEEMSLFIGGGSVLAKLATLRKLIDQAERWSRGEPVNAVSIHIKLTVDSQELKAVIYGPPSPGEAAIILPGNFTNSAVVTAIDGLVLRFKRAGLWLAPDDTSTTASSAANPSTLTATLTGTADADSPYEAGLTGMAWNEEVVWNSFILATSADTAANAAKKLVVFEAELMAAGIGPDPLSVSDSTNKARGNNVLRFDFPSAGNLDALIEDISASVHPDVRRWSIFVSCRNNSGTTSFRVKAGIASGQRYVMTPPTTVPADYNDNKPFWMYLGQLSLRQSLKWIFLNVESDDAGTLDFDSVALLAADNPVTSQSVAILPDETAATGETFASPRALTINHALEFDTRPHVYFVNGSSIVFQNYNGNPALFAGAAEPALAMAWLACGRWNKAYWRATDASGTVISNAFGATRMKGQLTIT